MIHGGDIYTEGIFKGRKLLDYSSNINPLGLPQSFVHNIDEALKNAEVYPDINYRNVIKSIKEYIGLNSAGIVLGNGASEIIELSISLFKTILIVVPSYVEYELDAKRYGIKTKFSYLSESMEINYEDIFSKLKEVDALIIGNPNNPNGGIIDKNKFRGILDFCEENGKKVIIDEAFIEFTANVDFSFVNECEKYSCIFIIRAMTKFFSMPGVRLGYGITRNEDMINKIKSKQNPWNVNCFAEMAAVHCLKDEKYIKESLLWIKEEREFFTQELKKIDFIERVFCAMGNFVLCKLKDIDENELYDYCLRCGIVIRRAGNFRGLDESFIRLAIKDRISNRRLLSTFKNMGNEL